MLLLGCHTVFMFISHSSCERASHSSVFVYLLFHSAFTLFFAIVSVNVGQVCVYAWCVCGVPMLDGWRLFFVSEFYSYFIFADDCVIYQRVFSDRLLIVFYSIASMPWDGLSVCFKSDFFISFSLSLYLPLSRSIYLIDIRTKWPMCYGAVEENGLVWNRKWDANYDYCYHFIIINLFFFVDEWGQSNYARWLTVMFRSWDFEFLRRSFSSLPVYFLLCCWYSILLTDCFAAQRLPRNCKTEMLTTFLKICQCIF